MQVVDHKNIEKRILFYCAKLFTSSLKSGYDYSTLEKSISILITNYELENQKDIEKYITKWNLREETYPMHILTDTMEIYIIELKKFKKFKDNSNYKQLNSWIKFIESSEEEIDMSNKEIVKAKKVLEEISQDEHERYLAELREKYIANPPEGMTPELVRNMSDSDLLDMSYFLSEGDYDDEYDDEGFFIF